jgi:hypothetical protein
MTPRLSSIRLPAASSRAATSSPPCTERTHAMSRNRAAAALYDSEATVRLVARQLDELKIGDGLTDTGDDAPAAEILGAVERACALLDELGSSATIETSRALRIRRVLRDELELIRSSLKTGDFSAQQVSVASDVLIDAEQKLATMLAGLESSVHPRAKGSASGATSAG